MITAVYGRMNSILCTAVPAVDTRISASRKKVNLLVEVDLSQFVTKHPVKVDGAKRLFKGF
jgi:hypothetical protein